MQKKLPNIFQSFLNSELKRIKGYDRFSASIFQRKENFGKKQL